jgi:hypothetical protein
MTTPCSCEQCIAREVAQSSRGDVRLERYSGYTRWLRPDAVASRVEEPDDVSRELLRSLDPIADLRERIKERVLVLNTRDALGECVECGCQMPWGWINRKGRCQRCVCGDEPNLSD